MILALSTVVMYLLAALMIGRRLLHQQGPDHRVAAVLAIFAMGLHLSLLTQGILLEPGQNMSFTNVASLIAWLIALSMTAASLWMPNLLLLPVVLGFAALVVLINLLIPVTHIMHIDIQPALLIHITLALFAYGILMIALLYALQLAYINQRLKQKQASLLNSPLPPLMMVESIFFKLLVTGTALLTLSLISGFVFLDNMFATQQAHKTVLSLLAWLIYVIVLVGHQRLGWRGKPVITATITGSVLLTLAYFGSRFVKDILLGG
ncbi:cytochrome c biogenesis protein CcsA [Aestuariibacter halophilus]|uniref:Cytochrome c biogenesis protein CcsA n=1 Tax=Fluctibacter halophilus TaxID=226011 RepID=A0ABS8G3S5_9ALTE|nr:cytochrome c biogenesis protein CcsA [Aestuariibacter halophilus]MCC2615178.1 cytochrome c biogenesis protein CcsA [Aestuariibacter halophilus]